MGLGGISVWQLLIILAIVVLLFGTKKLRTLGGDLGSAVRSFKGALKDGEEGKSSEEFEADQATNVDRISPESIATDPRKDAKTAAEKMAEEEHKRS